MRHFVTPAINLFGFIPLLACFDSQEGVLKLAFGYKCFTTCVSIISAY